MNEQDKINYTDKAIKSFAKLQSAIQQYVDTLNVSRGEVLFKDGEFVVKYNDACSCHPHYINEPIYMKDFYDWVEGGKNSGWAEYFDEPEEEED